MSYDRHKAFCTSSGVIFSENLPVGMQWDNELSHKQKEGITVNCSQIAIILAAGPPTHADRQVINCNILYVHSTVANPDSSTLPTTNFIFLWCDMWKQMERPSIEAFKV